MFHVFVEGATDGSPAGLARLADAISAHYGIAAPDLLSRLSKGRFRVKGNTDRATAEAYVRDLTRLGARCTIEEAQPAQRLTPTPFPAIQPAAAPRPAAPTAPPPAPPTAPPTAPPPAAPTAAPTAPPQRTSSPAIGGGQQYQSGLSAAFSGEQPVASLGALEGDNLAFALSSVDGNDDRSSAVSPAAFAPPADPGVAATRTEKAAKAGKPKDEPLDMFAPPDAQEAAFSVDIADDEKEFSARKRASTPPANVPVVAAEPPPPPPSRASTPAMRRSAPSIQPATEPVAAAPAVAKKSGLANPTTRFVAGVFLSFALGFVPAHFIGKMREQAAFEAIDRKVIGAQNLAETPDQYALLDQMRSAQLAKKYSERKNAAIIAILVWAAVAGGLAFVWFKKIDWERLEA